MFQRTKMCDSPNIFFQLIWKQIAFIADFYDYERTLNLESASFPTLWNQNWFVVRAELPSNAFHFPHLKNLFITSPPFVWFSRQINSLGTSMNNARKHRASTSEYMTNQSYLTSLVSDNFPNSARVKSKSDLSHPGNPHVPTWGARNLTHNKPEMLEEGKPSRWSGGSRGR